MGQQAATIPGESKIPTYAWVVLFAVYVASLAAPFNQFKVPPVLPILKQTFDLSYSGAGMMMSSFSIMGLVLAIPSGFLVLRFGIKTSILLSVASVMIGSVLGAISHSSGLLFVSRFIEGLGMGLILVAAPAAIAAWFPAQKRGLPMGLWATCVAVGSVAALNVAPVLAGSSSWRSVWWAGAALAAVALVLFGVLFRLPGPGEVINGPPPENSNSAPGGELSIGQVITNRGVWLISLELGCFAIVIMALSTFYPDFLNTVRHYSLAKASLMTSVMGTIAMFSAPVGGYLSDRLGSRKAVIIGPFILWSLVLLFPFTLSGWAIPVLMVASGILGGPIAPVSLALVPELVPPQHVGIALGVVAFGQNLGMFAGPALFGWIVETTSWATAGYLLIPVCVVAIVAASLVKIR